MLEFFQSHGLAGVISIALVILALFNIIMTGIAQAFLVLHKQEPVWMQKIGAAGVQVAQWMSANVPVVTTNQAQKAVDAALLPSSAPVASSGN